MALQKNNTDDRYRTGFKLGTLVRGLPSILRWLVLLPVSPLLLILWYSRRAVHSVFQKQHRNSRLFAYLVYGSAEELDALFGGEGLLHDFRSHTTLRDWAADLRAGEIIQDRRLTFDQYFLKSWPIENPERDLPQMLVFLPNRQVVHYNLSESVREHLAGFPTLLQSQVGEVRAALQQSRDAWRRRELERQRRLTRRCS